MLIYSFKVYKHAINNFLHTFNCCILLALSIMLPLFLSSSDTQKLKISGYVSKSYITILAQNFILLDVNRNHIYIFHYKLVLCHSEHRCSDLQKNKRKLM